MEIKADEKLQYLMHVMVDAIQDTLGSMNSVGDNVDKLNALFNNELQWQSGFINYGEYKKIQKENSLF
jgi:hypothetical protein